MANDALSYPRIVPAGDAAVTVEFGDSIDESTNDRVLAFTSQIPALNIPGIIEVVPTYRSATLYLDPLTVEIGPLVERLVSIASNSLAGEFRRGHYVEIPVLYGGEFGADLPAVAAFAKRSIEDVITLHSSQEYRCYMLGFSPGFPYLGRVPDEIAAPRLSEPRVRVPAGSIGIAGAQTGIYPQSSPGGWQLIGRTPLRIFDLGRKQPFLIQPGDSVRFRPISRKEFGDFGDLVIL